MLEDFEGNIPEIRVERVFRSFFYYCKETSKDLVFPCCPTSEKCYDCLGFNSKFAYYFEDNIRCSCGKEVDFGYFMIIYCLERAGLLPKDFKMQCCRCKKETN